MTRILQYQLAGLCVQTTFPLPELTPFFGDSGLPTVSIRIGAVPTSLREPLHVGPVAEVKAQEYLLAIDGVARYHVQKGSRITIETAKNADEKSVRLFLFGTVFGALLHQRGLLPLHASAIEIAGHAVAFVGESGAGKSTLAALLQSRGYRIMGDDICVVSIDASTTKSTARALLYPDMPRLKLWQQSLDYLDRSQHDLNPVREGLNKFYMPLEAWNNGPLPLAAIYRLRDERVELGRVDMEEATKARAAEIISRNTYRPNILAKMGLKKQHFTKAIAMVECTPVYTFSRLKRIEHSDGQLDYLEHHWQEIGLHG